MLTVLTEETVATVVLFFKNQQLWHLKYYNFQIWTPTTMTEICDKDRGDTRDPFLDLHYQN